MKKKNAHSHVIQNLYDIRSSVEHIRRYFEKNVCNLTFRVPLTSKVWTKDILVSNDNLNGLVTTFLPNILFSMQERRYFEECCLVPLTWMKTESCLITNILSYIHISFFLCSAEERKS